MASTKNRKLALNGLLTALALILSYVEGQIPAFFAVPGMKLGLTNIVVLLALYCMGAKSALAVNFVRIVLVSILFGNGVSFWYSLAGGLLSGAVMIALKNAAGFRFWPSASPAASPTTLARSQRPWFCSRLPLWGGICFCSGLPVC